MTAAGSWIAPKLSPVIARFLFRPAETAHRPWAAGWFMDSRPQAPTTVIASWPQADVAIEEVDGLAVTMSFMDGDIPAPLAVRLNWD